MADILHDLPINAPLERVFHAVSRPGGYGAAVRHPVDGLIDALMLAIGPRPVGFSLQSRPFGKLPVKDTFYRHGADQIQ